MRAQFTYVEPNWTRQIVKQLYYIQRAQCTGKNIIDYYSPVIYYWDHDYEEMKTIKTPQETAYISWKMKIANGIAVRVLVFRRWNTR